MTTQPIPKKTMVCVTVQMTCERLIREGAKLAGEEGLSVVHVVKNGGAVLGDKNESNALEFLFRISREYGAEMDMLRSADVTDTLVQFARENEIGYLVIGAAGGKGRADIAATLRNRLPDVRVFVIP